MSKTTLRLVVIGLALALSVSAGGSPKLDEIIEVQQKRIAERPDDAVVHNDLANLLVAAGRLEEAEAAYDKALALAPNASAVRFNRGLLKHEQGALDEAEADYLAVVEWEPDAWAFYQLGRVAVERGQKERAVEFYARAFALDTELALAEVNPHVIDNEHVTEALLQARHYSGSSSRSQVPRQYGEGERIAKIMLANPEPAAAEGTAEAEEDAGQRNGDSKQEKRSRSRDRGAPGESGGTRVLDSGSLDKSSSVGQAKPSGAPAASSGVAPRRAPIRTRSAGGHQGVRPTPSTPPRATPTPPPSSSRRGAAPSRAPNLGQGTVRGAIPRYRPTRSSTSSLSLELLPALGPTEVPARG